MIDRPTLIKLLKTLVICQLIFWSSHTLIWVAQSFYYVDWQDFIPLMDPEQRQHRLFIIFNFLSVHFLGATIRHIN